MVPGPSAGAVDAGPPRDQSRLATLAAHPARRAQALSVTPGAWPGWGSRAAPRPASSGRRAATARPGAPRPGPARSSSSSGSSDCGWSYISAHGSPSRTRRSGTVTMVRSSGTRWSSSSQRERRRHAGHRPGPHRPRPEHRLVRRVLVEVDEHARPALLLPPRGGHEVGAAALELAGQRHRGEADVVGVPSALQAHVDVHAAVAGGLREAGDPQLVQERPRDVGRLSDHLEARRRATGRGRCGARRRGPCRPSASARRGSRGSRGSPPRPRAPCPPAPGRWTSCRWGW